MESQNPATRRRLNVITSHFIPHDATLTHLFPMNCSSSLNPVIQRRDNKTYFARQSSDSQACFMRQQLSTQQEEGVPLNCTTTSKEGSLKQPLFSRPTTKIPKAGTVGVFPPLTNDSNVLSATEPPQFSRPNTRTNGQKQLCCSNTKIHALSTGCHWSPRLDVAESGRAFVVTVELPGVDVDGIRVEVNDKALTVKGVRRSQRERVKTNPSQNFVYHKKEIFKGPYQVVWPLPPNVDKDSVSATFVDGFLQVTIPRL